VASPSARVYPRLRDPCPNLDDVLRFSVYAESVQRAQDVLPGKETGKNLGQWFRPSTAASAIRCVDVAIIAAWMLTFLSDGLFKASQKHRLASRLRLTARSSTPAGHVREVQLGAYHEVNGAREPLDRT
jgi:hypothetical protein